MQIILAVLLFFQIAPAGPLLDNDFVRVTRNSAPCAGGAASCGERVFVALRPLELGGKKMERGDIKGFKAGERYSAPKSGEYLEVVIKPGHPKVMPPPAGTPPAPDNKILYEGKDFFVASERMALGEVSKEHSHNVRVAIFLNKTQVQQWTNGKEEIRDLVPDVVNFRPAVVHISKDIGKLPIRNLLIEFKP
jgi:hypothetical protein